MDRLLRASWLAGAPFRAVLIGAIALYRMSLSGWLGGQCRFAPTCSRYAEDAIRARGAVVGSALAAWRILRCNPFGKGGLEPAPAPRHTRHGDGRYDEVIHTPTAPQAVQP